jgi:MFS family permease
MELTRTLRKNAPFNFLYLLNFLVSFHLFLLIYINSSFLATFVGEDSVGIVYIASALLSIAALWISASMLKRFGNYQALVLFALLEFFAVLGLAAFEKTLVIIPLFLLHGTLYVLMLFSLDIFLESYAKNEDGTGGIRGTFLTAQNIALILAPLAAGLIAEGDMFWRVYILSSLFLIPFLFVIMRQFQTFDDPPYEPFKVSHTIAELRSNQDLYNIFAAQFLMRFFFSWMVIYTPIYLNNHIGFSWSEIGIMFTIMLVPYLLIEWPAGKIADRYLGEKELLSLGFVITAAGVATMSLATEANIVLWIAILLVTRIGAALLEIMTESYFFKHVQGNDSDTISFFRMARPTAYVIGPLVATILLFMIDFQYIFLVLGLILLLGLRYSTALRDTK